MHIFADRKLWKKIPFAGTLEEQSQMLENLEWPFAYGHLLPREEIINACKDRTILYLDRTEGDTLVSWKYHNNNRSFLSTPEYPFKQDEYEKADDKLLWLIENVKPFFDEMKKWREIADYTLTYEGLMNMPIETLWPISSKLNLHLQRLVRRSKFRGGRTYRKGVIGSWGMETEEIHREKFGEIWIDERN